MRCGISTACLYPMLLEESLSKLISMNFHLFEIFLNTSSEMERSYLDKLDRMIRDSDSSVKSVHPFTSGYENFLLFSSYERRFEDGLEFYKRYFSACSRLGAKILVLHGRRCDKISISDEEYFERYLRLFALGKTYGVTLAQENVNLFCSDSPSFIERMRAYCGEQCAFVFDVKQAVRGGEDPMQLCKAMGDRLAHVHINDNSPASDCLLPGFGRMDLQELSSYLKSWNFPGDLMIEVYRKSFGPLSQLYMAECTVKGLL